jgi:hypothetical protein
MAWRSLLPDLGQRPLDELWADPEIVLEQGLDEWFHGRDQVLALGCEEDAKGADNVEAEPFAQISARLLVNNQLLGVKLDGKANGLRLAFPEVRLENWAWDGLRKGALDDPRLEANGGSDLSNDRRWDE